ncbi:MAG: hypothetical protein HOE19_01945 [Candidatus Komeilibacteria bacterium]|nr:hypothetical protein [Candidatus Komeilibacteria bacterium]MBT4447458.1 hypothetical protein [Candidatus Komeilibacteria bacterium]
MLKKIILFILLFIPNMSKAAEDHRVPLPNPIKADNIQELSGYMIRGLLGVSGAIALFMLVWGGIVWMTSNGNAERLKKGKDTILWAILGLIIIFTSYIIINFLFTIIGGNA